MHQNTIEGFRLSPQQERVWKLQETDAKGDYRTRCAVEIEGEIDVQVLVAAVQETVARHEILRTEFHVPSGMKVPLQVIRDKTSGILLEEMECGWELDEEDGRIEALLETGLPPSQQDPGSWEPLEVFLFKVASGKRWMIIDLPALCADRVTLKNLVFEIARSFAARSAVPEPVTGPVQYADFSEWQNELLEAEETIDERQYWSTQDFSALSTLVLPFEKEAVDVGAFMPAVVRLGVDAEVVAATEHLADCQGIPAASFFLAVWQVLLCLLGEASEIVVGMALDGRPYEEMQAGLGLFERSLPIHLVAEPGAKFLNVLDLVSRSVQEAGDRQEYFHWDQVAINQDHTPPLLPFLFEFTDLSDRFVADGLSFTVHKILVNAERFKLRLSILRTPSGLRSEIHYDPRRFDVGEIQRLAKRYQVLARSALREPQREIGELELFEGEEKALLLRAFSSTPAGTPSGRSILDLFEQQVERAPEGVAVAFEEERLSYAQLDAEANRLAHHLRRLGAGPDTRIGILLDRSIDLVVGVLGALKSGGAYVPLDPAYPAERLAFLVTDAKVLILVTRSGLVSGLKPAGGKVVALDADWDVISHESSRKPAGIIAGDSAAYVIYTSGSTGQPKGVVVSHGSLLRSTAARLQFYREPVRSYLLLSSLAFDSSVAGLFWTLCQGGALCLVSEGAQYDPRQLGLLILRREISHLLAIPSLYSHLLEQVGAVQLASLRTVVVAGEACPRQLVNRHRELLPEAILFNEYGPTEGTVWCTVHELTGALGRREIPIGRPVPYSRIYLVGVRGNLVPIWNAGELCIGGTALARGYLDRPGLTAERFLPDPFSDEKGARLYRTGDLARFLPAGTLEFLGRLDQQVKVRGYRVELGEIEDQIRSYPEVREAVVLAREDQPGERRLVAYVTGASKQQLESELRERLKSSLPEYMVPAHFVLLDELPRSPNGKLDRRALPPPEVVASRGGVPFVAPRTETERLLAGIWSQVLGREQVGAHDDFFEAGGHSLLATQLISRVSDLWRINVPVRDLFQAPTIAGLAERIENERRRGAGASAPPVERAERAGDPPLSFSQLQLWLLHQLAPESPAYNLPVALRMHGRLEVALLEQTLSELARRHEILRTSFPIKGEMPVQSIAPSRALRFPIIDLGGLPEVTREALASSLAREEASRAFDLSGGPLLRLNLLRLGQEDHLGLFLMHHIVSDGWSAGILVREVGLLYGALLDGRPSPLPDLAIQYADFSWWQRGWLQGETLESLLAYWRNKLAGAPAVLDLPADRPRPAVQSLRGAAHSFSLSLSLATELAALARRQSATLFMVLLSTFQVLLRRYTTRDDICVGTPIAGRNRLELEPLIGFFVNALVLRVNLPGDPTLEELLSQVRDAALDAQVHQDLPFEELVDELRVERSLSHTPLFQVMFTLENAGRQELRLPGLSLSQVGVESGAAKFDLDLAFTERDGRLTASIGYSLDLFDAVTVQRLADHLQNLLVHAVTDFGQRISELALLSGAECLQLTQEWNDTRTSVTAGAGVVEMFEAQVDRTPEAVCLVFRDGDHEVSLQYGELNRRSNRLARRLRTRGVTAGVPVGLCAERSPEMVVGLLAIFKAGGAFVPLDPSYPQPRLAFMLEDSEVPLVLTEESLIGELPARQAQILPLRSEEIAGTSDYNLERLAGPADLAYLIYTSGTTGKPKAVMVEHQSLECTLAAARRRFGFSPGDRMPCIAPFSFDIFLFELLSPLLTGGTSLLFPLRPALDVEQLVTTVLEVATVLHAVPALMRQIVDAARQHQDLADRAGLRAVFTGGDAVPADLLSDLREVFPGTQPWILYGPTEAAIFCSAHPVPCDGPARPLLGRPLDNSILLLCDRDGQPVPIGVPGEIWIGGSGVARGYWRQEALTAERFVNRGAARFYRSGDLARRLPDGNLEFLGRMDDQVKIRGFRIELGEVELALAQHGDVKEAVVVARHLEGGKRLVAYVVALEEKRPQVADLRAFLGAQLPDYMAPAIFVVLPRLPLTANGKVDRQALPAPDSGVTGGESFVAPRGEVEELLAAIWSQVLGRERVSVDDNFFELGGDSILGIQVIARANRQGLRLTPRQLFQHQTIAELGTVAATGDRISAEQGVVTGQVPLTPIQSWFFDQDFVDSHHFNQSLALELREAFTPPLLERAVRELLVHHDALRLRFERSGRDWRQAIADPPAAVPLTTIDLSGLPEELRSGAFTRGAGAVQMGCDLFSGPLSRFALFTFGASAPDLLLMVVHHLAVDGVSWRVLLEDLETAVQQLGRGEAVQFPDKTTSFKSWAERLATHAEGGAFDQEWDYWLGTEGVPPLSLPTDHPGGDNTVAAARTVTCSLDPEETAALLQTVLKSLDAHIEDILVATLVRALAPWTGDGTLLIDLEGHGREDIIEGVDLSRTVGWFTAMAPVRMDLSAASSPGEVLNGVRDRLRAVPNGRIGYGALRRWSRDLKRRERLERLPAAEVSFNYLGQLDRIFSPDSLFYPAGVPIGPDRSPRARREHLLELNSGIVGGRLEMTCTYSENLHQRSTVERLVASLLGEVRRLIAHGQQHAVPATEPDPSRYRLSPLQKGLLFHTLSSPGSGVYVAQSVYELRGEIDSPALYRSLQRLIDRHTVLRTAFEWEGREEPLQVVHRGCTLPWQEQDWRGIPEDRQERLLEVLLDMDWRRGFDLTRPPLLRGTLIRLSETTCRLIWSNHHLILDGWSVPLLVQELAALYQAALAGRDLLLPRVPPFADYIAWLDRQDRSRAESFWRQALAGFSAPTALPPSLRPQQSSGSSKPFRERRIGLGEPRSDALRALARHHQLTLNTLVLGAWALLLGHVSGESDVIFGTTVSGRPAELQDVESMVGIFINTLPMRAAIPPGKPLVPWLQELQALQAEMRQFEQTSLVDIQGWCGGRNQPLFESILAFQNFPGQSPSGGEGADSGFMEVLTLARTSYPLSLVTGPGRELVLMALYDGDRFDACDADRILGQMAALLEGMAVDPDRRLAELPWLSEPEAHQILLEWNAAWERGPVDLCVHDVIQAQVERTPDAVAVEFEGRRLTYRELNGRANQLAHRLRRLGVAPEVRVGVCMERSLDVVAALLGILKSGGAYLPLDPTYPQGHLATLIAEGGVSVLITQPALLPLLPRSGKAVLCLDAGWEEVAAESPDNLPPAATVENLAYVIYTSGSTGRPKGVAIPHRAVLWSVSTLAYVDPRASDRFAQGSTHSFDAATFELWGSLAHGSHLVGIPKEVMISPHELAARLQEEKITVLYLTAALFMQTVSQAPEAFRSLRRLLVGGDVVDAAFFRKVLASGSPESLLHLYGPTETTVFSSWAEIRDLPVEATKASIGYPIAGAPHYLLDRDLRPVCAGVFGEAYIGGGGVARGYLGQPELTAERFVPDPYGALRGAPGARLYRTGDLVRHAPDGRMEFGARIDSQVKIRGFRIEPGEIESALVRHGAVREALVLAREDVPGDRRLVAYLVLQEGQSVIADDLRCFLTERLPSYMVPAAFVPLPALPLSPNGKVDRKALPPPQRLDLGPEEPVRPRTPTEEVLIELWRSVLRLERVGLHEDFFALGGHSLLATQLISRLRETFQVELPIRDLFDAPTVAGLAGRVEAALRARRASTVPPPLPLTRRSHAGDPPLSFAQQRLWLIDQLEPGSPLYNIPIALRVAGRLRAGVLAKSLEECERRHEALRTTFTQAGDAPVQKVSPSVSAELKVVDLSALGAPLWETTVQELAAEEAQRPFDLIQGPLWRSMLLRLAEQESVLLVTMHHIVSDGWSMEVLVRDVSAFYRALIAGSAPQLPELPIQYADFAQWQRQWLADDVLSLEAAHWREQLAGAPAVLAFPADRPRPARWSGRGAQELWTLPAELSGQLLGLARSETITPFMLLMTAFQILLFRHTGEPDLCVGTPIAGRSRLETEGLIGFFVNTLVLRADLSGDPEARRALHRGREVALDAYVHQDLPFEKLVEELQPERSLAHAPIFQVLFAFQNTPRETVQLPGLELTPWPAKNETVKFDFSLFMSENEGRLSGSFQYATDLFDPTTAKRLLRRLELLLESLVADPGQRLSELMLVSAAERHQLVWELNDSEAISRTERAGARMPCLHELFERQARRTPKAVAILFEGEELTYRVLDRWSNRLACRLREAGARPGERVGICCRRSPAMVAMVLGVLKSGAAYVALDPGHPRARLAEILEDASPRLLLVQEDLAGNLPSFLEAMLILIPAERPDDGAAGEETPRSASDPYNPAYVVYTSGSTGHAKGVLAHHRGVVNHLSWMVRNYGLSAADTALQLAPLTFDASIRDLFGLLLLGGRVVIVPEEVAKDPEALLGRIADCKVTCLPSIVPSMLRLLTEAALSARRRHQSYRLRLILTSGERLYMADGTKAMKAFGSGVQLYNQYGPTECTMISTYHRVHGLSRRDKVDPAEPVAVGRPIANTRIHVLDPSFRPVPLGAWGEVAIGGRGLTYGYLGQPDRTAEMFVPDPLDSAGERLYRTGDFGRYSPDGILEFQGRIDHQVKLRGLRVELGEIESALRRHDAVLDAVVVLQESGTVGSRLVAYIAASQEAGLSGALLRSFLQEWLPDYMVPSAWMLLDALPLTPHNKVDRVALCRINPDLGRDRVEEREAARTPFEELIAGIWCEVLELDQIGVKESFFDLGGHSLLATLVLSRLRSAFQIELPLRDLFEEPTVAGLAGRVELAIRAGTGVTVPPITAVPRDGSDLPLSFAQQRLWFIDQLEPGSALYNIPNALRVEGRLEDGALERALCEVLRRHEALRTVFVPVDGAPRQRFQKTVPFILPLVDLSALAAEVREAVALHLGAEEALRPFDLGRGPLLRASLLRLSPEEHLVLLTMHHIVSDGWSMGILVRELVTLYAAFAAGKPSPLSELPVQYADFAVWQRDWLGGEAFEGEICYWRNQLGGAPPVLELPRDRPRPALRSSLGAVQGLRLPELLSHDLRNVSRQHGVTLFMTLLAGFQALLVRYGAQHDVSVGTPLAGRTHVEVESLIGFFVNTLVLRTDLGGDPGFRELLERVRDVALAAHLHQGVPFEKVVEVLQPERSLSHTPLFQVAFVLQNAPEATLEVAGLSFKPVNLQTTRSKFDLTLGFVQGEGGLSGWMEYGTDLFDGATITRLGRHLENLLGLACAAPNRRLSELEMLSEPERLQLLQEWNGTASFPVDLCLHGLFESRAKAFPEAVAVSCDGESLTYGELNRRSNRLAHYLRGMGAGPEEPVGIYLNPSCEMVVGILGALKAGGAYVPLDPSSPRERLDLVVADSGMRLLITEERLAEGLPMRDVGQVRLDRDRDAIEGCREDEPAAWASPEHLAYTIFTSGSTGRPKGVWVTHGNVVRLLRATESELGFGVGDVWTLFHSVAFDFSVWELWGALAYGGRLVVVPYWVSRSPRDFHRLLVQERVTVLNQTPSAFRQLVQVEKEESEPAVLSALRLVIFGGETLDPAMLKPWFERHGDSQPSLVNMYGITETTVHVTLRRMSAADAELLSSPIGLPLPDLQVYLLGREGELLPPGAAGEIEVGGSGLARGYAGRADLTAERFVPDPFGSKAGERLYRSGDLARRRGDGRLEYLGRIDRQVKIRGFRIELGEIEAALSSHADVGEAAVLAQPGASSDRRLVAYLVSKPGRKVTPEGVRSFLRERLPDYMVPSFLMVLEALPVTSNGKLDRKALAALEGSVPGSDVSVGPRNPLEEVLAGIWCEVLELDQIGVKESFFDLGGHSLLAVRLMARIEKSLGLRLPVSALFQAVNIEQMAAALRRQGDTAVSSLVAIQARGENPPIFCVHPSHGNVLCFLGLAQHLGTEQPFYGIQVTRGLREEVPADGELAAMAADYLEQLRIVQPEGPYYLGGWSMGGVVAYEMARQLELQGESIALLALLDAQAPTLHSGPQEPDETSLLLRFAGELGLVVEDPASAASRLRQLPPEQRMNRLLDQAKEDQAAPTDLDAEVFERLFDVFRRNVQAMLRFVPEPFGGRVTLLKAAERRAIAPEDPSLGWSALAGGGVDVFEVPGDHYTMVREPNVAALANRLRECLGAVGKGNLGGRSVP